MSAARLFSLYDATYQDSTNSIVEYKKRRNALRLHASQFRHHLRLHTILNFQSGSLYTKTQPSQQPQFHCEVCLGYIARLIDCIHQSTEHSRMRIENQGTMSQKKLRAEGEGGTRSQIWSFTHMSPLSVPTEVAEEASMMFQAKHHLQQKVINLIRVTNGEKRDGQAFEKLCPSSSSLFLPALCVFFIFVR